jgi:hypothetical protein
VVSLCCNSGEAKTASTRPTEQRHRHGSETRSLPDVIPTWTQDRHLDISIFAVEMDLRAFTRIRKNWGMQEVLETQSCSLDDRGKVQARVNHLSSDFLEKFGYFDWVNL